MIQLNKHGRGPKRSEAHVRLYAHELACPAYRHLSTDARALLVELRSFYSGGKNEVFLSIREMEFRLECGQRRAENARNELLANGWIRVLEKGAFSRKSAKATTYALTNEPLNDADGATAPKDYMRWQPPVEQNTVAKMATVGSQNDYRALIKHPKKDTNGSRHDYRNPTFPDSTVAVTATQISYQGGLCAPDVLIWAAITPGMAEVPQLQILVAWLLVNYEPMRSAA